ncbi:MAG: flagellum-specific ATP synthase FliI, partial [Marinobacter sp.]|nr:flagellum-specific ATP synthase FliI [Marinobacter sp.]
MIGNLADRLDRLQGFLDKEPEPELSGRLTRMVGLTLECVGCPMVVGDRCVIQGQGTGSVEAEVVGFEDDRVYLMPLTAIEGLRPGARVVPLSAASRVPVGPQMLGRVVNGSGEPLDGKGPLQTEARVSIHGD